MPCGTAVVCGPCSHGEASYATGTPAAAEAGPGRGPVQLEPAAGVHTDPGQQARSPVGTTTPDASEAVENGTAPTVLCSAANEPAGGGGGHGGGARVGSEFGVDAGQMGFDGALGQVKPLTDRLVGQTLGDQ